MSDPTDVGPIAPNPGGRLPASQILGRDALIESYWDGLRRQSLALFSQRRVGKTSVLRRMEHLAPGGWQVRFRDLEGLDSAPAFAQLVYEDAREFLSGRRKALARARDLLQRVSGSVEIKNVKVTLANELWRRLLQSLFADLQEELEQQDEMLVFLWDEFTLFIGDLANRGMENDAMILLDTLRSARQQYSRIRMVLTGSIGFHLVMRQLDARGYRNRPINDVRQEPVPMLDADNARPLVVALLRGIEVEPSPDLVDAIIRTSEGHPFVIQHIADSLKGVSEPRTEDVVETMARLLRPPSVLDLGHYSTRLSKYYGERKDVALRALDLLSKQAKGLDVDDLARELSVDRSELVPTLKDLRDDDYVIVTDRTVRFALDFVRRFWREDRMV